MVRKQVSTKPDTHNELDRLRKQIAEERGVPKSRVTFDDALRRLMSNMSRKLR